MKQKYSCTQCDHQATTKSSLARHKEAIHDGIRYPCDHCSYQATTKSSLSKHKIAKHKQIISNVDCIKSEDIKYEPPIMNCENDENNSSNPESIVRHTESDANT